MNEAENFSRLSEPALATLTNIAERANGDDIAELASEVVRTTRSVWEMLDSGDVNSDEFARLARSRQIDRLQFHEFCDQ